MGSLAVRIRELMKKHELLTEKELSIHTGVPQPTINRILSGNTKAPRRAALKAFSSFFKVPLHTLLESDKMNAGLSEISVEPGTRVPLFLWANIHEQLLEYNASKHHFNCITSFKILDGRLFALVVGTTELEPRFPRGTILVFKIDKVPKNRDYILISGTNPVPIMKQILLDGNERFVKSLDGELNFPVTKLEHHEQVIAVLVQSIYEYGD